MNYVLPQASEISEGVNLEEIEPVAGQAIKLALTNESFKILLLSEAKSAITEATGLTLPISLEIRVYEDTPTVKHLVLPVNPAIAEATSLTLPTSLEIRVYQDTPTVKHLVLPVNPASEELSDLELEAIATAASYTLKQFANSALSKSLVAREGFRIYSQRPSKSSATFANHP